MADKKKAAEDASVEAPEPQTMEQIEAERDKFREKANEGN